jgi:hypothetical protein
MKKDTEFLKMIEKRKIGIVKQQKEDLMKMKMTTTPLLSINMNMIVVSHSI